MRGSRRRPSPAASSALLQPLQLPGLKAGSRFEEEEEEEGTAGGVNQIRGRREKGRSGGMPHRKPGITLPCGGGAGPDPAAGLRGGLGRLGQPRPAALRRGTLLPPCGCGRPCTRRPPGQPPRLRPPETDPRGTRGTARPAPPRGPSRPASIAVLRETKPPRRAKALFSHQKSSSRPPRRKAPARLRRGCRGWEVFQLDKPQVPAASRTGSSFSKRLRSRRYKPLLRSCTAAPWDAAARGDKGMAACAGSPPSSCFTVFLLSAKPGGTKQMEILPQASCRPLSRRALGKGARPPANSCHFVKPPLKTSLPKDKRDAGLGRCRSLLRFPTQARDDRCIFFSALASC